MDIAGAAFALAALGCHAQLHLHIVKVHARPCAARNGVVRDSTADANYHVAILNENDSQKQVVCLISGDLFVEKRVLRAADVKKQPKLLFWARTDSLGFVSASSAHLRLRIVLQAYFFYELKLRFQKVNMLLGVIQNALQQIA